MLLEFNNKNAEEVVQGILERIIAETDALGCFLVDESGFLIAEAGAIEIDRVALSALVSATFGATAEVARILGEPDFSRLTHHGLTRNLYIARAGKHHILLIVFGPDTNLGLIKIFAQQFSGSLADALDLAREINHEYDFNESTKSSLKENDEEIEDIF